MGYLGGITVFNFSFSMHSFQKLVSALLTHDRISAYLMVAYYLWLHEHHNKEHRN